MSLHALQLPLCQSRHSQLLIIDAQERLAAAMPKDDLAVAVANINRLVQSAMLLDIPIIATEQYPKGLGKTIGSIKENLAVSIKPTEKTSFSCCTAGGFENDLTREEGRQQLILVGMESHICILQTAAGLQHWGYQVFVVADAICSRNSVNRDNALERMRYGGIQVTNTESVAFEWLGDCAHDRFKQVSALFK